MLVIGVTGGIGTGKTTVCELLRIHGIPVFNSDVEAKEIYNNSNVRNQVIDAFGKDVYNESGELNRQRLAEIVFGHQEKLERLNSIIHPEVGRRFEEWKSSQESDLVVKEAAILFESGAAQQCDKVVVVASPDDLRIARVMKRDAVSRTDVEQRIDQQWPQSALVERSDFVIENDGKHSIIIQVNDLVKELRALAG